MKPKWAIGLDLGGTNARMALVDRNASVREAVRRATREVKTPQAFVAWAAAESDALLRRNGIRRADCAGMGVGVPGPVDSRHGRIQVLPNLSKWKNVPLRELLTKRSGLRVVTDNDGNAMTMAEYRFGVARGVDQAIFITLGTGLGCGIIYEGKLFRGSTFSAAEISHMRHGGYPGGALCGCGSRGCIETRLGNRALRARAEREMGKKMSLEEVTQAAAAGHSRAIKFWAGVAEEFGDFLGGICNLLNPEMIVIGGGVAGAGKFLFTPLRKAVARHAFKPATKYLRIVPAKFGADAGIIGAAALAFARSEDKR